MVIVIVGAMVFILLLMYSYLIYYATSRQQKLMFHPNCNITNPNTGKIIEGMCGTHNDVSYWWIPRSNGKYKTCCTILYFHGSSGNMLDNISVLDWIDDDFNVLMIDYRGYGNSKCGIFKPSESSIREDAQSAYNLLFDKFLDSNEYEKRRIIVWGMSMGGFAAAHVAANNKVGMLILLNTFSSIDAVVKQNISKRTDGLLYSIVKPFMIKMNITKLLKKVTAPILILHSKNDELISIDDARYNYNNLAMTKSRSVYFIEIDGIHSKPIIKNYQTAFVKRYIKLVSQ